MVRNPGKHLAKIKLRIKAVEFGCADQGIDSRSALSAYI
jgi:hypothetical protein